MGFLECIGSRVSTFGAASVDAISPGYCRQPHAGSPCNLAAVSNGVNLGRHECDLGDIGRAAMDAADGVVHRDFVATDAEMVHELCAAAHGRTADGQFLTIC